MAPWLPKLLVSRDVDAAGRVLCPIGLADVDLTRCQPCPYLRQMEQGEDGQIEGIVCQPSYRSLAKVGAAD